MAIETKEKEINGVLYRCTQFTGRKGWMLKGKLLKLLGPSFVSVLMTLSGKNKGSSILDADMNNESIVKAVEKLVENLADESCWSLVMELLSNTKRDGKELTEHVFNVEFAGDYLTVYKVLLFVIQTNYGNFLREGSIGAILNG